MHSTVLCVVPNGKTPYTTPMRAHYNSSLVSKLKRQTVYNAERKRGPGVDQRESRQGKEAKLIKAMNDAIH